MRLVTNERLIKRNGRIGRVTSILGLAVLLGGLLYSFRFPEQSYVPFATLMAGFLLSNVGIYFANRWVKPPRPDQAVDSALKGLDDRYVLYHYRVGGNHVLGSPSGVYALIPKSQPGEVRFTGNRSQHRGGTILRNFFGQEGLGNPSMEAESEAKSTREKMAKLLPGETLPPVSPVIVFTNESPVVEADDAPFPTVHAKKLKGYLRNLPKRPTLSKLQLDKLDQALGIAEARDAAKA